jgi:Tfp pilus assembly PilM family ATPase
MIAGQLSPSARTAGLATAFDYWQLDRDDRAAEDREKLAVLAVDDDTAVQTAREIERAGLECRVLDGQPLCVARAVEMIQPQGSTSAAAALDWGYEHATLSIVRHGLPQFTRELRRCGMGRIVGTVGQGLGVSPDDAQQLVTQYGLPTDAAGDAGGRGDETVQQLQSILLEITAAPLAELVAEIEKTLHYLRFQRPELHPQSVVVMGGGAAIRHVEQHLSPRLSLPLSLWTTPLGSARLESGHRLNLPMLAGAIALSALAWAK